MIYPQGFDEGRSRRAAVRTGNPTEMPDKEIIAKIPEISRNYGSIHGAAAPAWVRLDHNAFSD
jgi:hypothetical protein